MGVDAATAVAPTVLYTHAALLTTQPHSGTLAQRVGAHRRAVITRRGRLVTREEWPLIRDAILTATRGHLTEQHLAAGQFIPADWCAYLSASLATEGEAISRALAAKHTGSAPTDPATASRIYGGWIKPLGALLQLAAAEGGLYLH